MHGLIKPNTLINGSIYLAVLRMFAAWIIGILGVVMISPSAHAENTPPAALEIDASIRMEEHLPLQGFLHGFSDVNYQPEALDMRLLQPLKPAFWRIGFGANFGQNYHLAKKLNPEVKISLVLGDLMAVRHGGYHQLKPWRDWAGYEREIRQIVQAVHRDGYAIDYWDIWSEPDVEGYWSGSCDQVMEMFKRTHDVIRSVLPEARIVGPSISSFKSRGMCDVPFLARFVEYTTAYQLKFDALSWHEFEDPRDVPAHVAMVRQHYRERPTLAMPEIHINEYSGPLLHNVPASALGWLYSLEQAGVNWASRACWDQQCQAGLNGVFNADNRTPNPIYWVYRAYAELPRHRLQVKKNTAQIAVMAGRDDEHRKLVMLVGGFPGKQSKDSRVSIHLSNYPYPGPLAKVMVKRIPDLNGKVALQQGPQLISSTSVGIEKGAATLALNTLEPGAAYVIEIAQPAAEHQTPGIKQH